MNLRGSIKPLDAVAIAAAVLVTALSAWLAYGPAATGRDESRVVVEGKDKSWVYPLSAVERVSVPGPIGETVVEIRDGHADVLSSPCENQTCVAAGAISRPGQWIACLPNAVFVRIEGTPDPEGIDAATW